MIQPEVTPDRDEKNNTGFRSTTGNNFYRNKSEQKMSHSYANLPMRKDIPHWNISSAVLRNSSTLYSIPKDVKLKDPKVNYYDHYKLTYPSSLSHRATTFGYGKKASVPEVFSQNKNEATRGVPFYEVDDMIRRRSHSETIKRGKTIGQSWSAFKGVRAPHRNTVHCSQQVKANPGHKYIVQSKTGGQVPKSSMHSRLRMFSDVRAYNKRDEPGPQNYLVNEENVKKSAPKTNFGLGTKYDFTDNPESASTPGPVYNLSGFCDKFTNTKIKNLGKSWK